MSAEKFGNIVSRSLPLKTQRRQEESGTLICADETLIKNGREKEVEGVVRTFPLVVIPRCGRLVALPPDADSLSASAPGAATINPTGL